MATPNYWIGNVNAVNHKFTITITGPATGVGVITYKNGAYKSVTAAIANTDTATIIASNLLAAIVAAQATIPEIAEETFTGSVGVLTGIANTAGMPAMPTASVTAAIGVTVTVADVTPNTGPNFAQDAANWSLGKPTSAHDCIVNGGPDILFGLGGFAAWCLSSGGSIPASLHLKGGFRPGSVGLPQYRQAPGGQKYLEFRPRFFETGILNIYIGEGDGGGPDLANVEVPDTGTLKVFGTQGVVNLTCQHGNAPTLIAVFGGTVTLGYDPYQNGNAGVVTVAAVNVTGGTLSVNSNFTVTAPLVQGGSLEMIGPTGTCTMTAGNFIQSDSTLGTLIATGGHAYLNHKQTGSDMVIQATGTHGQDPPVVDCSTNDLARHIGAAATSFFKGGAYLLDPFGTCQLTTVVFSRGESWANSDLGGNVTVTR